MLACSKRDTRIDLDQKLVPVFFLQFFPCWLDQDIVNIERAEKLLPVVDPVQILRLVGCDLSGSHIYHIPHLLDGCLDLF